MQRLDKSQQMAGKESTKAELNEDRMHHMDSNRDPTGKGPFKVMLGAKRAGMMEGRETHTDRNKEMAGMGAEKFDVRAEKVEREKRAPDVEMEPAEIGPKKVGSALKMAEKKAARTPKKKSVGTKEKK
jgi:hypothetical protein